MTLSRLMVNITKFLTNEKLLAGWSMKVMAFIPARGGSKGIPRKNLIPLAGKPLIQYTIEAARKSRHQLDLFISSDDLEIIGCCRSLGVAVEYQRPPELARDETPMADTIVHALEWLRQKKKPWPQAILLLQPTSPLRSASDIDQALDLFMAADANSLISVHRMVVHPYLCLEVEGDGWRFLARPFRRMTRRQEYEDKFYTINGAIFIVKTEFFMQERTLAKEGESLLYKMDPNRGEDIDTLPDLQRAEFFIKQASPMD
jgi:CMP-N,N'-diacetyllegionaminic acid synthase